MDGYLPLVINDPTGGVHECCPKMDHDIQDKKELNHHVHDDEVPYSVMSLERHVIRDHKGDVHGQD